MSLLLESRRPRTGRQSRGNFVYGQASAYTSVPSKLLRTRISAPQAIRLAEGPLTKRDRFGGGREALVGEILDRLQTDAGHVITHRVAGGLGVGGEDRPHNFVVRTKRMLGLARHELQHAE